MSRSTCSGPAKGLGGHVVDYLALRRALGFKLERVGLLLDQFIAYLDDGTSTFTIADAVTWATLPAGGSPAWHASRLSAVRGFALYLHALDPTVEVPAADVVPGRTRRATPFLYSDSDLAALITAAATLRTPLRVTTYQSVVGLLAVTGMRVGEAIRLDRGDADLANGVLIVRHTKFDKTRMVPLHPTTTLALAAYLRRRDQLLREPSTAALFISPAGTRLLQCNVESTFRILVARGGLTPGAGSCRPRMHDLRHSLAVATLLDAYCTGADIGARLALLSTFLGHVDPKATYWYLSAAPELMAAAAERLEHHQARS